jgi:hypothetical protein
MLLARPHRVCQAARFYLMMEVKRYSQNTKNLNFKPNHYQNIYFT